MSQSYCLCLCVCVCVFVCVVVVVSMNMHLLVQTVGSWSKYLHHNYKPSEHRAPYGFLYCCSSFFFSLSLSLSLSNFLDEILIFQSVEKRNIGVCQLKSRVSNLPRPHQKAPRIFRGNNHPIHFIQFDHKTCTVFVCILETYSCTSVLLFTSITFARELIHPWNGITLTCCLEREYHSLM